MNKRRSCAECGLADHHVADCTTYKQGMKSLGYTPDADDMRQIEEHEFYSGLIIKIGSRCFLSNQKIQIKMDCRLFWEALNNQSQTSTCAVQTTRKRQAEIDLQNKDVISSQLSTKSVKAVTKEREREMPRRYTGNNLRKGGSRSY